MLADCEWPSNTFSMFYFVAIYFGLVLAFNSGNALWITCLIPTCNNTCGRNNTKTFLEIFFIGYHFITALLSKYSHI